MIERLKQLEAAATPSPWTVGNYDGQSMIHGPERTKPVVKAVGSAEFEIISDEFGQVITPDAVMPIEHRPNALLIAEMRNALVPLLDRLEKLEAVAEAADGLLEGEGGPHGEDPETWLGICLGALAALEKEKRHD